VAEGEALRVADIHYRGALLTQLLGLGGGDALEFAHGWLPLGAQWRGGQAQRCISPLSTFSRVLAPPQTQPLSRAYRFGSEQRPSSAAQWPKISFCLRALRCGWLNQGAKPSGALSAPSLLFSSRVPSALQKRMRVK